MFAAAGVSAPKAAVTAACLVDANLRGVDSHGILLAPRYLERIDTGDIDIHADGAVISESGACLHFDGENGMGAWVADSCCTHASRIASTVGIGMAVARDSNHFGAAAFWGKKLSAAGHVGIVMCNASPLVSPWQGKQGTVGTNPICVSVPGPWLLDMATTTVAANRIFKALINGHEEIPAGWALDADGVPTTSTAVASKGLLQPLGGYKGSGLAVMVEILCAVLAGSAMGSEVGGIRRPGRPSRTSQMYLAIDISRFMPVDEFRIRIEKLVGMLKAVPVATGYDEILVAGDPEWRTEAERVRNGIPIEDGNWNELCETATKLGVAAPAL